MNKELLGLINRQSKVGEISDNKTNSWLTDLQLHGTVTLSPDDRALLLFSPAPPASSTTQPERALGPDTQTKVYTPQLKDVKIADTLSKEGTTPSVCYFRYGKVVRMGEINPFVFSFSFLLNQHWWIQLKRKLRWEKKSASIHMSVCDSASYIK